VRKAVTHLFDKHIQNENVRSKDFFENNRFLCISSIGEEYLY